MNLARCKSRIGEGGESRISPWKKAAEGLLESRALGTLGGSAI